MWEMTLRSIMNRIDGFFELEQSRQIQEWHRARMIAYYAVIPHIDSKKSSLKKPEDLFSLPGERPEQTAVIVDMDAMRERWSRWDKQIGDGT